MAGYSHVSNVVSPGEYSIRGGLIDLYPMGSVLPYRIDLFDDEIDSIKTFDVDTQRTLYPVPEIRLLPAREFPLDDKGRACFRQRFREVFEGDPGTRAHLQGRHQRHRTGRYRILGCRSFSTRRRRSSTTCRKTRPSACTTTFPPALRDFWRDAQSRYTMLSGEAARPLLPPADIFLSEDAFFIAAKPYAPTRPPPPAAPASPKARRGRFPPLPSTAVPTTR